MHTKVCKHIPTSSGNMYELKENTPMTPKLNFHLGNWDELGNSNVKNANWGIKSPLNQLIFSLLERSQCMLQCGGVSLLKTLNSSKITTI
jgi:hypothetical protein